MRNRRILAVAIFSVISATLFALLSAAMGDDMSAVGIVIFAVVVGVGMWFWIAWWERRHPRAQEHPEST